MDARLKNIMNSKIDEVIRRSNEILAITKSLESLIDDEEKTAFGIALGRCTTPSIIKQDAFLNGMQRSKNSAS